MVLKKITISNFKMFEHLELAFDPGFNLILGDNGVGKTTVLEAASVVLSGFLVGMEDVYARSIYKNDVRYQIVKDSNGTPNKSYSSPAEVSGTLEYNGTDYTWTRTKKDATGNSRTTIIPKDIVKISQELVNDPGVKTLPLVSYQSTSRHWVTAKSYAYRKKGKQLHDRRCGYLGCLDRPVDMQSVYGWCRQMEWNSVKKRHIPGNYAAFGDIISKFMSTMNDGQASGVLFDLNAEKLLYKEKEGFKEIEDMGAGYQSVLNLVIDLAYRMAILNPDAGPDTSNTEGIVLVDEIDSNLHPKWQWRIVEALTETFPNIQFIAATHSPIIVSSCKRANIISIDDKQNIQYMKESYAFSVNEILRDMLGYHMRPENVENLIENFEDYMDKDEYTKAGEELTKLVSILGTEHPKVLAMKSEYEMEAGV